MILELVRNFGLPVFFAFLAVWVVGQIEDRVQDTAVTYWVLLLPV